MEDESQKAKDYAFNLLSYRERSRFELEERLIKKGFSKESTLKVLDRLEELGYIDDHRFARMWVNYRIKHKPRGRYLLLKELKDKGVAQSIIQAILEDEFPDELEYKLGKKLAQKWLATHKKQDNSLKLKRYLKNKGFSYSLIRKILANITER